MSKKRRCSRFRVSNILSLFSDQIVSTTSLQEFIQSFSSLDSTDSTSDVDLDPFLSRLIDISDLSAIECNLQVLQSLTFIAGYAVHQYLKRSRPCQICRDVLTIERDLVCEHPLSKFKLLELTDRGGLKYPSEVVLESIVTALEDLY